jgi:hypothetical protein
MTATSSPDFDDKEKLLTVNRFLLLNAGGFHIFFNKNDPRSSARFFKLYLIGKALHQFNTPTPARGFRDIPVAEWLSYFLFNELLAGTFY